MKELSVAITGRVNVGKSTLFNRLVGKRLSITHKVPKITRDPVRGELIIGERKVVLWDTGGYIPQPENSIEEAVNRKIMKTLESADLILFVLDGREGVTGVDEEIASLLRKYSSKVAVVVNKIDSRELIPYTSEFYTLGFSPVIPASAQSGLNVAQLIDFIDEFFKGKNGIYEESSGELTVTIAGRPNVGKSTLLNALTGKERAIVTDLPGTTRDPVIETARAYGMTLNLVDTAGVRRRPRIRYGVEFFSVGRSLDFIERTDGVIVVADAGEGIVAQDVRLLALALRKGKVAVLAVNKMDLIRGDRSKQIKLENSILHRLKSFHFVPVVKISALAGEGLRELVKELRSAAHSWSMRIPTSELNSVMKEVLTASPPPGSRKGLKVKYVTQVGTRPPHFVMFANRADIPPSYVRYLKNVLRKTFNFKGTEILLELRSSRK